MAAYVHAFESTHAAIAAQVALADAGVRFSTIPTPREISAGCGISLLFEAEGNAQALAHARSIDDARGLSALYRKEGRQAFTLIERL